MGLIDLVKKALGGSKNDRPDPDGEQLALMIAKMADPIELLAPLGGSVSFQTQGQQQSRSQRRASLEEQTQIVLVARPAAARKLRESGHLSSTPQGDVFKAHGKSYPFFGYAEAPMDDEHWGVELRRVGSEEWAVKDLRALREQEAESPEARACACKKRRGEPSPSKERQSGGLGRPCGR